MTRRLVVEVVGDVSGLQKSFTKASGSATGFGNSLGKLSIGLGQLAKGVLVVDGFQKALQGLHDAVGLGIGEFTAQQKVATQTAAVLKSTGGAANITAKQVDALALSLSNLSGKSKPSIEAAEDALLSFTKVANFRGAGNDIFTRATKDAIDFSARTGKDATVAATAFGKALQDPATRVGSLARAGLVLTKSQTEAVKALQRTSGVVAAQKLLLSDLETRYLGAAKAAGDTVPGQLDKLKNALAEVAGQIIGKNVTGTESLLAVGVKWAQNADNQAKVAHDVQTALHDLGDVAKILEGVFKDAAPVVKGVSDAFGGTKRSLELLIGTMATFKVAGLLNGFTAITGGATVAAGEVGVLQGRLLALERLGPIAVAVDVLFTRNKGGLKGTLSGKGSFGPNIAEDAFTAGAISGKFVGGLATDFVKANLAALGLNPNGSPKQPTAKPIPADALKKIREQAAQQNLGTLGTKFPLVNFGKGLPKAPGGSGGGLTQAQKNSFFDSAISSDLTRAGLQTSINSQIGALQNIAGLISARLAATKDVTRRRTLEDQLLSVQSQIRGDQVQLGADFIQSLQLHLSEAQATAGFGDDLKVLTKIQAALKAQIKATGSTVDLQQQLFDTVQQIKSTKISAIAAKDFKLLGFTATGDDITPLRGRLQKETDAVIKALSGTSLDTPKVKSQLANQAKILADALVPVPEVIRAKMQTLLSGLEQQLKDHTATVQKFAKINADSILDSIPGLSAAQKKLLRSGIDQIGPGGTVPGGRSPAFARAGAGTSGGITINGGIHLHGVQDVKGLEAELLKRKGRRASMRGGPYAGAH